MNPVREKSAAAPHKNGTPPFPRQQQISPPGLEEEMNPRADHGEETYRGSGLLEGRSELDCLKLASAVGASCVRSIGTTAGVFTRAEAEDFVQHHELKIEPIA